MAECNPDRVRPRCRVGAVPHIERAPQKPPYPRTGRVRRIQKGYCPQSPDWTDWATAPLSPEATRRWRSAPAADHAPTPRTINALLGNGLVGDLEVEEFSGGAGSSGTADGGVSVTHLIFAQCELVRQEGEFGERMMPLVPVVMSVATIATVALCARVMSPDRRLTCDACPDGACSHLAEAGVIGPNRSPNPRLCRRHLAHRTEINCAAMCRCLAQISVRCVGSGKRMRTSNDATWQEMAVAWAFLMSASASLTDTVGERLPVVGHGC
jgi:hypothetical protein